MFGRVLILNNLFGYFWISKSTVIRCSIIIVTQFPKIEKNSIFYLLIYFTFQCFQHLYSKNNIQRAKIIPSVVIRERKQPSLYEFKNT